MTNQNIDEEIVSISIYLHGAELQPDLISHTLNTEPTDSWSNGDFQKLSTGAIVHRRAGMWELRARTDLKNIEHEALLILRSINRMKLNMTELPGVEEAYLDIFVAASKASSFSLSGEIVELIGSCGLALQITFSLDRDP